MKRKKYRTIKCNRRKIIKGKTQKNNKNKYLMGGSSSSHNLDNLPSVRQGPINKFLGNTGTIITSNLGEVKPEYLKILISMKEIPTEIKRCRLHAVGKRTVLGLVSFMKHTGLFRTMEKTVKKKIKEGSDDNNWDDLKEILNGYLAEVKKGEEIDNLVFAYVLRAFNFAFSFRGFELC